MDPLPKPRIDRKTVLAFALFVTLILTGSVTYYIYSEGYQFKSTTESSTSTSVYNSNTGLQLVLVLGNNSINSGGKETIQFQVYNTLNSINSLKPETNYPSFATGNGISAGMCSDIPYGIAVIYGNYSLGNIDAATPLQIFEPGVYSCPDEYHVSQFQFFVHSSKASVYGNSSSSSLEGTTNFDQSVVLSGYWSGNLQNHNFLTFVSGIYTVVAADGWGQVALLHFYVNN